MDPSQRPTWWAGAMPTIALPLAVGAFTIVGTTFASGGQPLARPLDILGYALLLVGPAALGVRRVQPVAGLAVAAAAIAVYLGTGYPFGPIFLAPVLALFFAITAGHRLAAYSIGGTCFAVILLIHVVAHPGQPLPLTGAAAGLAWLVAVIAASEGWRARRERLAQTRAAREEVERRRGSEERLRIAQELHDVLGHHISLINVQAGVALYLMDDDPEQARTALAAIKQSSRELLHEMRATLGVLRGVDEHPPHQPVPGLARLDSLVAETRAAGLPVTVEIRGPKRDLPASVDLAAYRIVQEALTNTRKHAGPARARVVLRYDEHGLTVQVDDDGRGTGSSGAGGGWIAGGAGGGNGLPGMRERAQALGGTITAGPRPEGGFQIRAFFPTNRVAASVEVPDQ
ncbi:MAG: sensor histidine kinase [Actinomycetota bacterium]|nr:sensor histidine kinase [Actinomycetota bacterium]